VLVLVLVNHNWLGPSPTAALADGKTLLVRIVEMLSRMSR